ncbi:MAG: hypothetical protein AAFQ18_00415 [Pseudomonadota bacterium]
MNDAMLTDALGQSGATNADLRAIRRAGQWMPWAGLGLAVVWWVSVAITVVSSVDRAEFIEASALSIMAAIALAAVPGLVVLFAGYVAREGARRTAASNLILRAATQLLSPSKAHSAEAQSLAASLQASSADIDKAMETALSAMKTLSTEVGDERLRLESVTYAAADNARDLAARLSDERAALETLTRDLREQADTMGEIIPQQAAAMVDAARTASFDMAKSDEELAKRIADLKKTGSAITSEFAKIDGMAHTLQKQGDTLVFAVSRLETKLEEAQQTVEGAMRAGDAASGAAEETGKAMTGAVTAALDQARQLNAEIHASARLAGEEASRAMSELRFAAEQAAAAVREAGIAAREEGGVTEDQLSEMVDALKHAAGQPMRVGEGLAGETSAPSSLGRPSGDPRSRTSQPTAKAQVPGTTSQPPANAPTQPSKSANGETAPAGTARRTVPVKAPAIRPVDPLTSRREQQATAKPSPSGAADPIPPAQSDDRKPTQGRSSDETPRGARPILPPPAANTDESPQVVTLTSTRTAGFAQPNGHKSMPSRLETDQAGGPGPTSREDATARTPDERGNRRAAGSQAVPGGLPRQSLTQTEPEQRASPVRDRSVPRLDATPRELEDELFGGDDDLPGAPLPPRKNGALPVEENIFHANPRDAGSDRGSAAAAAQPSPPQTNAPPAAVPKPKDLTEPPHLTRAVNAPAPRPATPPASPDRQAPEAVKPPLAMPDRSDLEPGTGRGDAPWSSILGDIDREESGQLPREETAESVIRRLETSGIALSNIFRPKAKKKIATAARKGEQSRRAAIISTAKTEVDRVAKRLLADPDLAQMAGDFVSMEEADAIAALDRTQKSGRNASPRLSAFLLLDAATAGGRSAPH